MLRRILERSSLKMCAPNVVALLTTGFPPGHRPMASFVGGRSGHRRAATLGLSAVDEPVVERVSDQLGA